MILCIRIPTAGTHSVPYFYLAVRGGKGDLSGQAECVLARVTDN